MSKRTMTTDEYCKALRTWADLMEKRKYERDEDEGKRFAEMRRDVDLYMHKSCLLDRMLHGGEQPSQTKCPVHEGIWSGIHWGWPGTFMTVIKTGEKIPVIESEQCRKWYDAGCRCFQHRCGCTTGWQPDEACGCGVKP